MKIAITGHTRGIGKSIADLMAHDGHDVLGFSRANGHDITISDQRAKVLAAAEPCDIFINNAFPIPGRAQVNESWTPVELLYDLHRRWRGQQDKTIVVIGSETQNQPVINDHPYQVHKIALRLACQQLRSAARYPRIILICPGATDTDQIRHKDWIKMDTQEVARVVKYCIDSLDHVYVNEIIFTPGRKYQVPPTSPFIP